MRAIIAFDTEDVYYPPEYRIDDIPGWLAEIMTEVGITGTFLVMGEKALSLRERGRRDVLEKMAHHELGSHTHGNRHPHIPEVLQDKGWHDGVEAMLRYEDWVTEQFRAAYRKDPVALSRHNAYTAAQHVAVAGKRGLPYVYSTTAIPGCHQPVWYAGAVTFPQDTLGYFDGFDLIYSREELFEKKLVELDEHLGRLEEKGCPFVLVFACHPVRVMSRGWLEFHTIGSGQSRTVKEVGWHFGVKPREEEERAKASFRRLCTYLKQRPGLEVVGVQEAGRAFAAQPERIDRDALTAYAVDLADREEIVLHETFSPAELACGYAESLCACGDGGGLPDTVARRAVLGPTTRPNVAPVVDSVTHADLVRLSRGVLEAVETDGCLPGNLDTEHGPVGIAQFAVLAARAYLALARSDRYERLSVPYVSRYPEVAMAVDAWYRRHIMEHWAMPLDFACERVIEHARLQTWTMKPAWERPPRGAPIADQKYGARVRLR